MITRAPAKAFITIAAAAVLSLLWVEAPEADEIQQSDIRDRVQSGELVPLRRILDTIEAQYIGDILEVELEHDDGFLIYEVELLGPQGQLVEFEFDARDGSLLEIEGRDLKAIRRQ
ncbi:PepSY domain-containing protein [Algiphilus sp.]|uniref:PepSY domain-containing protein n=1 Tax=Algiphilus sp. TaxID=1872431 RepID=UPI0032F007B3